MGAQLLDGTMIQNDSFKKELCVYIQAYIHTDRQIGIDTHIYVRMVAPFFRECTCMVLASCFSAMHIAVDSIHD